MELGQLTTPTYATDTVTEGELRWVEVDKDAILGSHSPVVVHAFHMACYGCERARHQETQKICILLV